jgi:hypothetical protein
LGLLANQALEAVGIGKQSLIAIALRSAECIDMEPTGLADAGYGLETTSGRM